jgi:hypothetical protein
MIFVSLRKNFNGTGDVVLASPPQGQAGFHSRANFRKLYQLLLRFNFPVATPAVSGQRLRWVKALPFFFTIGGAEHASAA